MKTLLQTRVGTWVSEDVDLPNGRRATLETLHHPGAAAVVPFLTPERILLLRQYRFAAGEGLAERFHERPMVGVISCVRQWPPPTGRLT